MSRLSNLLNPITCPPTSSSSLDNGPLPLNNQENIQENYQENYQENTLTDTHAHQDLPALSDKTTSSHVNISQGKNRLCNLVHSFKSFRPTVDTLCHPNTSSTQLVTRDSRAHDDQSAEYNRQFENNMTSLITPMSAGTSTTYDHDSAPSYTANSSAKYNSSTYHQKSSSHASSLLVPSSRPLDLNYYNTHSMLNSRPRSTSLSLQSERVQNHYSPSAKSVGTSNASASPLHSFQSIASTHSPLHSFQSIASTHSYNPYHTHGHYEKMEKSKSGHEVSGQQNDQKEEKKYKGRYVQPKRPLNPFLMYRSERYKQLKEANPDIKMPIVSKTVSKEWREMSAEGKEKYWHEFQHQNELFKLKYPNFTTRKRKPSEIKRRKKRSVASSVAAADGDDPHDLDLNDGDDGSDAGFSGVSSPSIASGDAFLLDE